MSTTPGPSTSKGALAKLGAAVEKFQAQVESVTEPIKKGVLDSATRLVGLSETISKRDAEQKRVVHNLAFITTRVLTQLPPDEDLPEEIRDVVMALIETVREVEAQLKVDHGKLTSIVMSQISDIITDCNQKLDRHSLQFAMVGAVHTMKLVNGPGLGRPSQLPAALLPPKPAHFCGRDDMVATIVELLLKDESCSIPLLGPGGIGKTSIAVAAINASDVKAKYGRYIWFISCESMTSSDGIVASLAASLGIAQDGSTRETVLGRLSSCKRVLLVLDNLETIWDSEACLEVETLLQQLAGISSLSLLVTMRGAVSPDGIDWSNAFRHPVNPLTLASAREVWEAITGKMDEKLDDLLRLLDGLPLAINLMAQHGRVMTGAELIRAYDNENATLLARGAGHSRLTSLEVSIQLSLSSRTLREEPSASSILSLLCLLPDGIPHPDLVVALPSLPATGRVARLLLEAALVVKKQGRLCALAPIRDYILLRHPPDGQGLTDLRGHHMQLTKLVNEFDTDTGPDAINKLWIEFGNINAVLLHAWKSTRAGTCVTRLKELKAATLDFSWVPRSTGYGDCYLLLEVAVEHCRNQHEINSLAKLQQSLGGVLYTMNRYEEAVEKLEEAKGTFGRIGHGLGAAQCTLSIGDVLRALNRYDEAMEKLEEAKATFDSVGDQLGAAQCTQGIGNVLSMQNRYDEAMEKLEEAKGTFDSIGDRLGAAQCTRSIGDVLAMLNRYDEAKEKLEEAKETFHSVGDRLSAAECTRSIGDVLRMLDRYDEAMEKLKEAKATFDSIGNRRGAAECTQSIGNVLRMLDRYDEAMEKLEEAKGTFDSIGDRLGAAQCTGSIGDALRMLDRYAEAMESLEDAKGTFDSIGNRLSAADCMGSIGDALRLLHRYDEAIENLEEARRVCQEISDVYGLAWTYRRLKHAIELFDSIGRSGDVEACELKLQNLCAAAIVGIPEIARTMLYTSVPTADVLTSRLGRIGAGAKRVLVGLSGGLRRRRG